MFQFSSMNVCMCMCMHVYTRAYACFCFRLLNIHGQVQTFEAPFPMHVQTDTSMSIQKGIQI